MKDLYSFSRSEEEYQGSLDKASRNPSYQYVQALEELNGHLHEAARKLHQTDTIRTRTERLPGSLAASGDRIV